MKRNSLNINSTTLVLGVSLMSGATYGQIANGSFETGTAYVNGPNIFQSGTPTPWFATSFTPDCYDNTGVDGWNLAGISGLHDQGIHLPHFFFQEANSV